MSIFDEILNSKRKKALEQVAKREYTQSRGTAHAQLLRDARKRIERNNSQIIQKISSLKKEWQTRYNQSQSQLTDALHRHIVMTHLNEVPGIGAKYQDLIITHVFHRRLSDLRFSSNISGIGEVKQYQINLWINKYEAQTQELLKTNFPGKAEIISSNLPPIEAIRKEVEMLERSSQKLQNQMGQIDKVLAEYCNLTEEQFVRARITQGEHNLKIDNYLRGIFAEWESVPAWFQELIKED